MSDLIQKQLLNELQEENKSLKEDLIKFKLLSNSYQRLVDKIFESIEKVFVLDYEKLGINELFNEIKSLKDCNQSEAIVSIQEIHSNTEVIDNESKDNNNSETDIDFNENVDQMSDDLEEEESEECVCKTCGKHFSSKSSLRKHRNTHSDKYLCNECGFRGNCRYDLVYHKQKHSNDRPFSPKATKKQFNCNSCPKHFSSKHSLKKHENKHSDKYLCNKCGYKAFDSYNLVTHQRKHTNDRSFVCHNSQCKQGFKSKSSLFKHQKMKHKLGYKRGNRNEFINEDNCEQVLNNNKINIENIRSLRNQSNNESEDNNNLKAEQICVLTEDMSNGFNFITTALKGSHSESREYLLPFEESFETEIQFTEEGIQRQIQKKGRANH